MFVILLVIGGPVVGLFAARLAPGYALGVGMNLETIGPQLQGIFSTGSSPVGSHNISVPAYDIWIFPATASLSLAIVSDNKTVYRTEASSINLDPGQSGHIDLTIQISQGLVDQIQGKHVSIGGQMKLGAPRQVWNLTVNLSPGPNFS